MSQDAERDPIEDALLQMGRLDAAEAAIERSEAEGVAAEVPAFSSAKMDTIVAASLRAAALEPEIEDVASSTSGYRWVPWACAAAVAVAAAVVLWQAPPSQDAATVVVGPLPSAKLQLGGTARTLGDTPVVRAYGPGDEFFVELFFDAAIESSVFAELFARDSAGAMQSVTLAQEFRDDAVVFEGEIAEFLSPGVWTLQVRYGRPHSCSASTPDGCETLETRIEVVGP